MPVGYSTLRGYPGYGPGYVPRPGLAGIEIQRLRSGGEYHLGIAHRPYFGRPWYGVGVSRQRQGQFREFVVCGEGGDGDGGTLKAGGFQLSRLG